MRRAPGTVGLAALDGGLRFGNMLNLSAAPDGTFELLAKGDILFAPQSGSILPNIDIEDIHPDYFRNALYPADTQGQQVANLRVLTTDSSANLANNFYRGYVLAHADDLEPARLQSLDGSIKVQNGTRLDPWYLVSPKAVQILAGTDIVRPDLNITHRRADQISTVVAGRDIHTDRKSVV